MIRSKEEGDIIKRIRNYAKRCEQIVSEGQSDDSHATAIGDVPASSETLAKIDREFAEAMLKIIPYFDEREDKTVTVKELSELTGIEMEKLLEMLSANLYKSPYHLSKLLRNRYYDAND